MNNVAYFEIHVNNPQKAIAFYENIFGWKFQKDTNIPVDYWRISTNGNNGGLLKRTGEIPSQGSAPNAFVCSIQVENFDQTESKILQNGGSIALKKFAVPGTCWQGYFQDTEGNTFGLFQVDTNAK